MSIDLGNCASFLPDVQVAVLAIAQWPGRCFFMFVGQALECVAHIDGGGGARFRCLCELLSAPMMSAVCGEPFCQ